MQSLLMSMVDPHKGTPKRLPTFPAVERTAVMDFQTQSTMSVNPNGATSARGLLTRQPTFPLWIDQRVTVPWAYQVVYLDSTWSMLPTSPDFEYSLEGAVPTNYYAGEVFYTLGLRHAGAITPPWGNYGIYGCDSACGPQPFLWAPQSSYLSYELLLDGLTAGGEVANLQFEQWIGPGEVVLITTTFNTVGAVAGQATLRASILLNGQSYGWIRPKSVRITGTKALQGFGVSVSSASSVTGGSATLGVFSTYTTISSPLEVLVPVSPPPDFQFTTLPWQAARTTACASLFTNVTKALDKEGLINAGRLLPSIINYWKFSLSDILTLHPLEKRQLALETGFYTFTAPTNEALAFRDCTTPGGGKMPLVRLDDNSMVNAFVFTDSDAATPSSLAVSVDWHIEFRTASTLFNLRTSPYSLEQMHAAQLIALNAGFFWSNDLHETIAKKILPVVMAAAEAYGGTPFRVAKAGLAGYKAYYENVTKRSTKRSQAAPAATSIPRSALPPAGFTKPRTTVRVTRKAPRPKRSRRPKSARRELASKTIVYTRKR